MVINEFYTKIFIDSDLGSFSKRPKCQQKLIINIFVSNESIIGAILSRFFFYSEILVIKVKIFDFLEDSFY